VRRITDQVRRIIMWSAICIQNREFSILKSVSYNLSQELRNQEWTIENPLFDLRRSRFIQNNSSRENDPTRGNLHYNFFFSSINSIGNFSKSEFFHWSGPALQYHMRIFSIFLTLQFVIQLWNSVQFK
jgi:hypothetical protein